MQKASTVVVDDDENVEQSGGPSAFFKGYATTFFKPVAPSDPDDWASQRRYHVQSNGGGPAGRRHPDIYRRVMAMRVDFEAAGADNRNVSDPLGHLHDREKRLRQEAPTKVKSRSSH